MEAFVLVYMQWARVKPSIEPNMVRPKTKYEIEVYLSHLLLYPIYAM